MNIFDLNSIPAHAIEKVGGKAKGLFQLFECGLNVPDGFAATEIDSELSLQTIADHYDESDLGTVAVRSSAAAEDGVDFSSAGQYTTVLNVSGKAELKKAVAACIESLGSDTAIKYTDYFANAKSASMSVVVQKMVDSDISGVCFTQYGDDEGTVHIEAVKDLGENLVSGRVTANEYFVSKEDFKAEGDALLGSDMVQKIAQEACVASEMLCVPLDLEWAVKDGVLYWLQARPITVTEVIDAHELDSVCIGEKDVLTTCNIGEMMPGAVTPLTMSTSMYAIDHGVRRMIYEAGASKTIDEYPAESCFPHVGGTMFINLNTMKVISDYAAGTDEKNIEIVLCGRVLEDIPERESVKVGKLKRAVCAMKYFKILLSRKKACKQIDKLAEELVIKQCRDAKSQYHEIDKNLYKNNDAFWYHYISSGHSGSMNSALYFILTGQGMSAEEANAAIAGVLQDIDNVESVDILRSLRAVADTLVKENPGAVKMSAEELAEYLKVSEGDSAYALEHFIKRHGHRAIREAEIMSKSWHMDDISLAGFLKSIIASGPAQVKESSNVERNIQELLSRHKGGLKSALKFIIKQARDGVVSREFTKSKCIKILDQFKMGYIWLSKLMVEEKLLPESELIYFLKHDEIGSLINGEVSLVKRAVARRRVFEEQKQLKFNEVSVGKPVAIETDYSVLKDSKVLLGASISCGKVTGKARIVKCIEDANQLEKGEIMVAAFTDIGWSPYYSMASALVTEVGSVLSHGAVVAREYALPLVSNIPYATKIIKTGDMIHVDGNKGEVAIIEAAQ